MEQQYSEAKNKDEKNNRKTSVLNKLLSKRFMNLIYLNEAKYRRHIQAEYTYIAIDIG